MKLTHLRIEKLGPFYFRHELEIDPGVTILTGANDTGKSATLRLLALLIQNKSAAEMDVNQDYLQESQQKWNDDSALTVEAQFVVEAPSETTWPNNYSFGDTVRALKRMTIPSRA